MRSYFDYGAPEDLAKISKPQIKQSPGLKLCKYTLVENLEEIKFPYSQKSRDTRPTIFGHPPLPILNPGIFYMRKFGHQILRSIQILYILFLSFLKIIYDEEAPEGFFKVQFCSKEVKNVKIEKVCWIPSVLYDRLVAELVSPEAR